MLPHLCHAVLEHLVTNSDDKHKIPTLDLTQTDTALSVWHLANAYPCIYIAILPLFINSKEELKQDFQFLQWALTSIL